MSGRRSIRAGYYWVPQSLTEHQVQRDERQRGRTNAGVGNGAPQSYEDLIRDYHKVVMSIAAKAGLSGADAEDAAQTIMLRFWLRGGLEDYDPERLWNPPDEGWDDGKAAVPRTARFATMFKTFCLLSMRGERDRALRWYHRHPGLDEQDGDPVAPDCCETVVAEQMTLAWVARAQRCLRERDQGPWADAVLAAAQGRLEARGDWAAVLGCKVRSVQWAREQLAARLELVGMGVESLRSAS